MFAFGGIELIGMAAAEAKKKPFQKQLTKLFSVSWFWFIGNFTFISAMEPIRSWDKSPFVMIFSQMGIGWAALTLLF